MAGNPLKGDAQMVSNMVVGSFLNGDMMQQLMGVVQGAGENVPAAVAHAVFMNISQAREALNRNQIPIDDRIWVAKNGVLDTVVRDVSELIASNMGDQFATPEFGEAVKQELVGIMQEEEAGAAQGAPMQEGMAPQGMPMGMPPEAAQGLAAPMPMEGMPQ